MAVEGLDDAGCPDEPFSGAGEATGTDSGVGDGSAGGVETGAGVGVASAWPPPPPLPPPGEGELTGCGEPTAPAPRWLRRPAVDPPPPLAREPAPERADCLFPAAPAGARTLEPCSAISASAPETEVDGSLGSGAGASRCNCGVAKIATSASPVAVIKPRSAKVVVRILDTRLPPEKFGSRRAARSL